jgi:hypothetical protein
LVSLLLVSCSAPSRKVNEPATIDTTVNTTISSADTESLSTLETETTSKQDTSQLNSQYTERRDAVLNETTVYYQVSITTRQYEAASDVIWYFDSSFSPRYLSYTWSAEGNDGSTELIIEGNEVTCGQVEELNTTERWCSLTGGIQTTWNEETGAADIHLLPSTYDNDLKEELQRNLKTLIEILKDGKRSELDEYTYLIKSEHKLDVGFEYTETVETKIPKELYDQLIQ